MGNLQIERNMTMKKITNILTDLEVIHSVAVYGYNIQFRKDGQFGPVQTFKDAKTLVDFGIINDVEVTHVYKDGTLTYVLVVD